MGEFGLKRTKMLEEAKVSIYHNAFFEVLIFIIVFLTVETLASVPVLYPAIKYILENDEYRSLTEQFANQVISLEDYVDRSVAVVTNLPFQIMVLMLMSTGLATVGTMIYCKAGEKRPLSSMGFRKNNACIEYLVGMLIGTVLFSSAVGICLLTGALEYKGIDDNIVLQRMLLFFLAFLIQGMSEEVIFRGYLTVSLTRCTPLAVAAAISGIMFALAHMFNSGVTVLAVINISLFGIFAAFYMYKRGNIWGVCAIHSLWNFVQGNFYGINVSGMSNNDSVMHMNCVEARSLINGGKFGLEGGLAVTVVLTAAIVIVLFTKTKECEIADNTQTKAQIMSTEDNEQQFTIN